MGRLLLHAGLSCPQLQLAHRPIFWEGRVWDRDTGQALSRTQRPLSHPAGVSTARVRCSAFTFRCAVRTVLVHLFVHLVGAGGGAVKLLDRSESAWQRHESPGSSCCYVIRVCERCTESVGEHETLLSLLSLAFKSPPRIVSPCPSLRRELDCGTTVNSYASARGRTERDWHPASFSRVPLSFLPRVWPAPPTGGPESEF